MKNFLLLSFLFLGFQLQAQVTVTNSIFPQAGDVLTTSVNTNPTFSPTTASGTAQTWDFSSLTTDFLNVDSIVAASSGPAFLDFPNTDIIQPLLGFGSAYAIVDSTSITRVGAGLELGFAGLSFVAPYADPHVVQTAPLTYNTTHNDQFEIRFSEHIDSIPFLRQLVDSINPLPVSPDSIRVRVDGSHTMLVDAFGTCTIYSGTYDVLRQKVETYTDISIDLWIPTFGGNGIWQDVTGLLGGFLPFPTNDTTIYYDYIQEGSKEPIARMNMSNDQSSVESMEFKGNNPTSVFNIPSTPKLSIFPNPATQYVQFDSESLGVERFNLQIIDLNGRVLQEVHQLNRGQHQIPLKNLAAGQYQIRFLSENGATLALSKLVVRQ
jgi:hypothetical protein